MKTLAPIALFCYKRLDTLKQTIEELKQNHLADESELYIFSDGAKKEADEPIITEIRSYLKTITGFKKISVDNFLAALFIIFERTEVLKCAN